MKNISQILKNKTNGFRSLRRKLLSWFLLLSLIPLIGLGIATFFVARNALQQNAYDKLSALETIKSKQLEDQFAEWQQDMRILVDLLTLVQQDAFIQLESTQTIKKNAVEYYLEKQLAYLEMLASSPSLVQALDSVEQTDWQAIELWLTQCAKDRDYDGLFIISAEREILYPTGLDMQDERLTRAFEAGLIETSWQDFEMDPSRNLPTAFIAVPIQTEDQTKGVMVARILPDQVDAIMQEPTGLGETGGSYLVGADKLFRSDDPRKPDEHIIAHPDYVAFSSAVREALNGETGQGFILNYRGVPVLSTWEPLDINGLQWIIITEIEVEEALIPYIEGDELDFLNRYTEVFGYDDLFLVNPQGYLIYIAEHQPMYRANVLTGIYKASNLGQLIREILESEPIFKLADFERFAPNNDEPAAFMGAPIFHQGELELVVIVQLSLDKINTIMQERTGLGETGETYLVGPDGLWRSDSRFLSELGVSSTVLNPDMRVDTLASRSALLGKANTQIIDDYQGNQVLSSWSPIMFDDPDEMHTEGVRWAVITQISQAEINRPVVTIAIFAGGIGLFAIIMVSVVTLWVSHNLSAPIVSVARAATSMAKGDLTQRADVSTGDEIEQMAGSFNSMADKLEGLISNLELRVHERTAELHTSNAELAREKQVIDTFMATVPDRIYFKDRTGHITRANLSMARKIGVRNAAKLVGKTDLDFFSEEEAQSRHKREQEIIHTGKPLLGLEEFDKDGEWALTTKMPLHDENGEIIGIFGISRDITELKNSQKAVKDAYQEISLLNERLKDENMRMSAELDVTRRLQQMMLPNDDELHQIEELDIAGFMDPADEIGGDYYDVLQHNGHVKIGIGDVTGHGLESGVLMLMLQTTVRTLLTSEENDPVRFMHILNKTIYNNIQRMNVNKNLSLSLLDYQPGQIKLSGQHEQLIVVRKNGQVELKDTIDLGVPIGLIPNIGSLVKVLSINLEPGDGIVLYSDGITEAENEKREFYRLERLCKIVSQHWAKTSEEIKQAVVNDVRKFIGQQIVYDDLTLLVIKQR